MITIDVHSNPELQFRIDSFNVPQESREEFEAAMRRNLAFLETLPGFLGHVVFEKTEGPTAYNLATMAVWRDREALEAAGARVREYYQAIGFECERDACPAWRRGCNRELSGAASAPVATAFALPRP